VVLIGDPDQAIYEWRTAHPELFVAKQTEVGWQKPSTTHKEHARLAGDLQRNVSVPDPCPQPPAGATTFDAQPSGSTTSNMRRRWSLDSLSSASRPGLNPRPPRRRSWFEKETPPSGSGPTGSIRPLA